MIRFSRALNPAAFCLASIALLSACGGGGGGGGGGTAGFSNVDVLLTDAPVDDLLAFRATVDALHLEIQGGGETANLLAGSVAMDLLGLQGTFAWMASQDVPAGTYTGVRLVFAPGSYDARRNDGVGVAVNALGDEMTLAFAAPVVVTPSGYRNIVVDVDLASSLGGLVSSPPITFDPQGSAVDDSSTSRHELDEFKGIVAESDAAAGTLVVDASVDGEGTVALGQVIVRVSPSTVLIADDGGIFASTSAFFAALVAGATHLEVHGALVNGAVDATLIEVEDNQAGGGEDHLVKITGLVLAVDAASFDMSIASVDQGAAIVAAANGGTIPASLQVAFDASTVFFGEHGAPSSPAALGVGARVKARFATFTNPPYLASRVEIENEQVENQGLITSIDALPSSLTVHLDATSPAVLGGQVASSSTDVAVSIGGATIQLDTSGRPSIASSALLSGLRLGVHGSVGGTPSAPTISASELEIHAGELSDARVNSIDSAAGRFTTSGGFIEEPFGTGVGPGPQSVLLAPNCVFTGDTTTRAGFWALFNGLDASHLLEVRVEGIGTGGVNEIRAYEVRARVRTAL